MRLSEFEEALQVSGLASLVREPVLRLQPFAHHGPSAAVVYGAGVVFWGAGVADHELEAAGGADEIGDDGGCAGREWAGADRAELEERVQAAQFVYLVQQVVELVDFVVYELGEAVESHLLAFGVEPQGTTLPLYFPHP